MSYSDRNVDLYTLEQLAQMLTPSLGKNLIDLDRNWNGYPAFQGAFDKLNSLIELAPTELCLTSSSKYIRECKNWFIQNPNSDKIKYR